MSLTRDVLRQRCGDEAQVAPATFPWLWEVGSVTSDAGVTSERGRRALGELLRPPRELAVAEAILTARCMERNGFRYPPLKVVIRARPHQSTVAGALIGAEPLGLDEARAHGYRYRIRTQPARPGEDIPALVAGYLATLTEDRQRVYGETLSPANAPTEQITLFDGMTVGIPTAGCAAVARAALFGSARDFLRWHYVPQGIRRCGRSDAHDDPAVRGATGVYAAGMRCAGYSVDGPGQATRAAAERFGLGWDEPCEQERAMAVADAEWQARSRLHEALDDLRLRDAAEWVATHVDELEELRDFQRTALHRARQIVDGNASV